MTTSPDIDPQSEAEAFERARGLGLPLANQLASYAEWTRLLEPAEADAYDALVAHLSAFDWAEAAPQIGTQLPDFVLPDSSGRLVALRTLTADGPLVVSFNRGHWCNYCRLELNALEVATPSITELGARVVSITPDRGPYAKTLKTGLGLSFPVLCDIDLGYALETGLLMPMGDTLRELFLACGLDLAVSQGHAGWFVPVPATFVVDRDARIVDSFIDPEFRRRMAVEDVLGALRRINSA